MLNYAIVSKDRTKALSTYIKEEHLNLLEDDLLTHSIFKKLDYRINEKKISQYIIKFENRINYLLKIRAFGEPLSSPSLYTMRYKENTIDLNMKNRYDKLLLNYIGYVNFFLSKIKSYLFVQKIPNPIGLGN